MLNDFKNVLITFTLVALIFVGSFFSYQKRIEAEDMGDSYQSEIQARDEGFENLKQDLVALQVQLATLERQNAGQVLEINRLANQLAAARNQPKIPLPVVVPQARLPVSTPVPPVVTTVATPKPTPKKVVVSKPSRRSRAS